MIVILGGTVRQAQDRARAEGLVQGTYRLIGSEHSFRGLKQFDLWLTGTYSQRRDWPNMQAEIYHCQRLGLIASTKVWP